MCTGKAASFASISTDRPSRSWWRLVRTPSCFWSTRWGLTYAEVGGLNIGQEEILGRNRVSVEPSQHGELTRMRHGIGERALKELFRGCTYRKVAALEPLAK